MKTQTHTQDRQAQSVYKWKTRQEVEEYGRKGKSHCSSFCIKYTKERAVITKENIRKWFEKLTDNLTKSQVLDVLDPGREY